MDSITILNDTLFLKNDTLYAKLGELTMNHKYIAESNGCGWANVVIWFLVCGAILGLSIIITTYLTKLKTEERQNNKEEKEKDRNLEDAEKQEEIKATYRAKILDYLEQETNSCKKVYDLYSVKRKEEKAELERINVTLEELKALYDSRDEAVITSKINGIAESIKTLNETIKGNDEELKKTIKDIGSQENHIKTNSYLKILFAFLENQDGETNLNQILQTQEPPTEQSTN